MTVKHLLRYGLMKKLVLVSGLNGSDWGGDIMNFEKQQSEMVLLNQMSREEFAQILSDLVKDNRELQRAILEVVWSCPNIVTQI